MINRPGDGFESGKRISEPVKTKIVKGKSGTGRVTEPVKTSIITPQETPPIPAKTKIVKSESSTGRVEDPVKTTIIKNKQDEKLTIGPSTIEIFNSRLKELDKSHDEIVQSIIQDAEDYEQKAIELIDQLSSAENEISKYLAEISQRINRIQSVSPDNKELNKLQEYPNQLEDIKASVSGLKANLLANPEIEQALETRDHNQEVIKANEQVFKEFAHQYFEKTKETLRNFLFSRFDDLNAWQAKEQGWKKFQESLNFNTDEALNELKKKGLPEEVHHLNQEFLQAANKIKLGFFDGRLKNRLEKLKQLADLNTELIDLTNRFYTKFTDDIKSMAQDFVRALDEQITRVDDETKGLLSEKDWRGLKFETTYLVIRELEKFLNEKLKIDYTQYFYKITSL